MTQTIDIFFRRHNQKIDRQMDPKRIQEAKIEVDFAIDTKEDLMKVIAVAREMGIVYGSATSGIFQIQTDSGIWEHKNGRRIDTTTPRKAANVTFNSWEQMEIDETIERDGEFAFEDEDEYYMSIAPTEDYSDEFSTGRYNPQMTFKF